MDRARIRAGALDCFKPAQEKGLAMNANNDCSTSCTNAYFPTARVLTGVLGFFALCTIATNYGINTVFDANVFFSVIATALVTCFAVCNSNMWTSAYQVFSGKVNNVADATCYWNTAAYGFLLSCVIFCGSAFLSAVSTTTVAAAAATMYFPFIVSICGYWVCKVIANACAYCLVQATYNSATNYANTTAAGTNVANDNTVISGQTVNS